MIPFIVTAHGSPSKFIAQSRARPEAVFYDCREQIFARNGVTVHFPISICPKHHREISTKTKLLIRLLSAGGEKSASGELVDMLWLNDKDGGPDTAHHVLKVQISYLRSRIAPLGLAIDVEFMRGYTIRDTRHPLASAA